MANKKTTEKKALEFRGRPLVRCGDTIYYGDPKNRFIAELSVKASHQVEDLQISEKVSIKLLDTDPGVSSNKKIIKMTEKNDLYVALDVASSWLDGAESFALGQG